MPRLDEILTALKDGPKAASELRQPGASSASVRMAIKRLRDAGHDIEWRAPGSFALEGRYHLRKLAGDMRPFEPQPQGVNNG